MNSFAATGEGLIQGGWILFDKDGLPQAAFQENAKVRVPIDDIVKQMQRMHENEEKKNKVEEKDAHRNECQ